MKKFLQRLKRQYLIYSRSDRNALLIIGGILLISVLINSLVDYLPQKEGSDFTEIKERIREWEAKREKVTSDSARKLFTFNPNTISGSKLDSLDIPNHIKRNIISYREAGGTFKSTNDLRKIYGMSDSIYAAIEKYLIFPEEKLVLSNNKEEPKDLSFDYFNPNTITAEELKSFGFSDFQTKNLVNYRAKGGVFQTSDDLLKIYGIDSTIFMKIKPFIVLDSVGGADGGTNEVDLLIELNTADSTDLMKLPGVGPAYAKRIIRYRELLGGYYSPKQLLEVYNFPSQTFSGIESHIYSDTLQIKKMRINFLEFSELLHHPYLNKDQVTQILQRRETYGAFKNISELASLQGFDEETIKRITPYLTCR